MMKIRRTGLLLPSPSQIASNVSRRRLRFPGLPAISQLKEGRGLINGRQGFQAWHRQVRINSTSSAARVA